MAQSDLNLALYPGLGWELQLMGQASAATPEPDQQPAAGTDAGAAAPSEPASE